MAGRSGRGRWQTVAAGWFLVCAVAELAGACSAMRVAHSASEMTRLSIRILQFNLCNSGIAGCYTGRSVRQAAEVIRAERPDVVTLNEVCRRDLSVLERAMSAMQHGGVIASAFEAAGDRRTNRGYQCRNGQRYGIGLLARLSYAERNCAAERGSGRDRRFGQACEFGRDQYRRHVQYPRCRTDRGQLRRLLRRHQRRRSGDCPIQQNLLSGPAVDRSVYESGYGADRRHESDGHVRCSDRWHRPSCLSRTMASVDTEIFLSVNFRQSDGSVSPVVRCSCSCLRASRLPGGRCRAGLVLGWLRCHCRFAPGGRRACRRHARSCEPLVRAGDVHRAPRVIDDESQTPSGGFFAVDACRPEPERSRQGWCVQMRASNHVVAGVVPATDSLRRAMFLRPEIGGGYGGRTRDRGAAREARSASWLRNPNPSSPASRPSNRLRSTSPRTARTTPTEGRPGRP